MLTINEVTIPLNLLFSMFGNGVRIMSAQVESGDIVVTSTLKQVIDHFNGTSRRNSISKYVLNRERY